MIIRLIRLIVVVQCESTRVQNSKYCPGFPAKCTRQEGKDSSCLKSGNTQGTGRMVNLPDFTPNYPQVD